MNRDIHSQAEQLNKKHRRKRTWYKILSVPICLVVFVTTYALIILLLILYVCFKPAKRKLPINDEGELI